jgi:hypothetical protein
MANASLKQDEHEGEHVADEPDRVGVELEDDEGDEDRVRRAGVGRPMLRPWDRRS